MATPTDMLARLRWWKRKPVPALARELVEEGETETEVEAALEGLVRDKLATCGPSPDPGKKLYRLTTEGKIAKKVRRRVYGSFRRPS